MLRFKILASIVPLFVVAMFARGGWLPGPRPCIFVGETSVQIASLPWHADLQVGFTDDPLAATVRVQLSDSAEAADFVVIDDIDSAETGACVVNQATRQVSISGSPAAALVVGAGGGHRRLVAASL